MKYFIENKTGNVIGYDSVEQADLISDLDTSLYAAITKLPTQFETWDVATKSFVKDTKIMADAKKAEIETSYRDALLAGVTYKTALFQSDEKSVQSLIKVLTALANSWVLPAGFMWVDSANVAHPATKTWLRGLNKAFGDHEASLFSRKLQAKAALSAIDLTSPTAIADIQAITW